MKASNRLMKVGALQMDKTMFKILFATKYVEMNEAEFDTFYNDHVSPFVLAAFPLVLEAFEPKDLFSNPLILAAFEPKIDIECFDSEDMETLQESTRRAAKYEWKTLRKIRDQSTLGPRAPKFEAGSN